MSQDTTSTYARAESMNDIFARLTPIEQQWRDRQPFLESHGYILRPRYRFGWQPSWRRDPSSRFLSAEDRLRMHALRPHLMDARRISDNELVLLKRIRSNSSEVQIATYLSSPALRKDPRNHCIPILDVLQDPLENNMCYLVMPFYRYIDNPPFEIVGDILECCDQLLEGLLFMHDHGVAHRDCAYKNVMMDATAMYPQGFHPMAKLSLPNQISVPAPVLPRRGVPVRYYFVDFGISSHFGPQDANRLVVGTSGLDDTVPELSDDVPYDPFKVDIYIMGNLFYEQFVQRFTNVNVLAPLVSRMVDPNPDARPTAAEALDQWRTLRQSVSKVEALWRPRPRDEPLPLKAVFDTVSLCSALYRSFF